MPFERILVAIDGSDCSNRAFAKALELAALAHAHVTALAVEGPLNNSRPRTRADALRRSRGRAAEHSSAPDSPNPEGAGEKSNCPTAAIGSHSPTPTATTDRDPAPRARTSPGRGGCPQQAEALA